MTHKRRLFETYDELKHRLCKQSTHESTLSASLNEMTIGDQNANKRIYYKAGKVYMLRKLMRSINFERNYYR